jgi:hypothetical protein
MTVPEVLALLEQAEREMKTYDFGVSMAQRKLNSSFALLAVQATTRYLLGEQGEAAADFATLADELRSRGHGEK